MSLQEHSKPDTRGPAGNAPVLINIKQVAVTLSVNERTIYRRVKAGDMPAPVKIGHLTRWRVAELQRWCEAGCPRVGKTQGGEK